MCNFKYLLAPLFFLVVNGSVAPGQTNISFSEPFAWGENIGWINLYANGQDGVRVTDDYLSGFAWSENVGWVFFGDGPDTGDQYSQAAGDTGVNNDGSGNLSGYAWGENIGWIVFDTTGSGGSQVTITQETGQFEGYAWSENVGWILFDSGSGVAVDTDPSFQGWTLF